MPLARHDAFARLNRPNATISTHMPLARHDYLPEIFDALFCDFYSHASCEAWRRLKKMLRWRNRISTHMPLARHDYTRKAVDAYRQISTHMPLARHDSLAYHIGNNLHISTHMPLARHDPNCTKTRTFSSAFLLTCLLRGMTINSMEMLNSGRFLLTCLLRGMTICKKGDIG